MLTNRCEPNENHIESVASNSAIERPVESSYAECMLTDNKIQCVADHTTMVQYATQTITRNYECIVHRFAMQGRLKSPHESNRNE